MKNLLFGLLATVLFAFNGNAQKVTQEDVRLQLATSMSQLVEQCKTTYKEGMTYEEFIKTTFNGNKISTIEAQNLMKAAFKLVSNDTNSDEIIKSYDGKEMASVLLIVGNNCNINDAVAASFGNDIANSTFGEQLQSKGCGWFSWLCDAAAWIWAHRKEILDILALIHWI